MRDDEVMSKRQRKKRVSEGVERLRAKPGWDPRKRVKTTAEASLRRLDQEARSEKVFAEADACPECQEQRDQLGDPSALCADHLASAMGF